MEVDLGLRSFSWVVASSILVLSCTTSGPDFPKISALIDSEAPIAVGFDLDDTLIFSSPAFTAAWKDEFEHGSEPFWAEVNSTCERFCTVKKKTLKILEMHQKRGDEVFVITARDPPGGKALAMWVEQTLGIAADHVFFEPNGKSERIKALGISIFYGDSDSDIADAQAVGVIAVRIERSPESTYKKKYNPGSFGELVIENSQ